MKKFVHDIMIEVLNFKLKGDKVKKLINPNGSVLFIDKIVDITLSDIEYYFKTEEYGSEFDTEALGNQLIDFARHSNTKKDGIKAINKFLSNWDGYFKHTKVTKSDIKNILRTMYKVNNVSKEVCRAMCGYVPERWFVEEYINRIMDVLIKYFNTDPDGEYSSAELVSDMIETSYVGCQLGYFMIKWGDRVKN